MQRVGPLAWTLPCGVVLGSATVVCWVLFAAFSRVHPVSCELEDRIVWAFAFSACVAGLCLPANLSPSARIAALTSALCAAVAFGAAWLGTSMLFPSFC